jgi:acyl carrier protein
MKPQEFIDLFVEELEIESIIVTPNTRLDSLEEWNSMGVMIAIGLAADNFDVVLKSNDLKNLKTLTDLMEKIGLEKFED